MTGQQFVRLTAVTVVRSIYACLNGQTFMRVVTRVRFA